MQCPTCRRTIFNEELCPRCGTNLVELQTLAQKADQYLFAGKKSLRARDFEKALTQFKNAYRMNHSPQAEKGIIVALYCLGQFKAALKRAIRTRLLKSLF